jgi:cation:H+ antiporter
MSLLVIVWLIVGLALIVLGADSLVDGSSSIARRLKVSEFVIGLTIVGMGTSAPEMVVSWLGAIRGSADIALGNVLGSNIFNTLLILGLTAIILPIGITRGNKRLDIPMNIFVTAMFIVFGLIDGVLNRFDGALFLALFAGYMWLSFRNQEKHPEDEPEVDGIPVWRAVLMILLGLGGLVVGGHLFVDNATVIAKALGVSDKFIAITLLAGGTSLPELATCVVAAAKKKGALALGNIIGSNLFNLLLIVGGSALIHPLAFSGFTIVDLAVLALSAIALFTSAYIGQKDKIDRLDGSLFVFIWIMYMTYLIINI